MEIAYTYLVEAGYHEYSGISFCKTFDVSAHIKEDYGWVCTTFEEDEAEAKEGERIRKEAVNLLVEICTELFPTLYYSGYQFDVISNEELLYNEDAHVRLYELDEDGDDGCYDDCYYDCYDDEND